MKEVLIMKDNKYYEDFKQDIIDKTKKVDDYILKADRLKRFHERIKNKKGMWKLIDKLVCWENKQYHKMGMKIILDKTNLSSIEMDELQNLLNEDKA